MTYSEGQYEFDGLSTPLSLFDSIYVATIKRNAHRQESLLKIAAEFGLNLKFVEGVDGNDLDLDKCSRRGICDQSRMRGALGYELTANEIACSLTHQIALKEFLDQEALKTALVLEDDVNILSEHFVPEDMAMAFDALKRMPAWDVLYLGYEDMNRRMPYVVQAKNRLLYPLLNACGIRNHDRASIRRCFGQSMNKYWFRAGVHNGAYAYAVSRQSAEKILAYNTPVWVPADVALMNLIRRGELTAFALERKLFTHDWSHGTSIGARASWK